jgi:hypothetical protein
VSGKGGGNLQKVARGSWTPCVINRATHAFAADSQSLLNMAWIYKPIIYYGYIGGEWSITSKSLDRPLLRCFPWPIPNNFASYSWWSGCQRTFAYQNIWNFPTSGSLSKHEDIIRLLLNRNANINQKAGMFGSPLQAAAVNGHLKIVKLLLDRGAGINAQVGSYGNAL